MEAAQLRRDAVKRPHSLRPPSGQPVPNRWRMEIAPHVSIQTINRPNWWSRLWARVWLNWKWYPL